MVGMPFAKLNFENESLEILERQAIMKEAIMIVDDEKHIINACRRTLINEDFNCHFFESPIEALSCISRVKPAVIVSDQCMDEMTGIELLSKIREIQPACVRMLMTGYADIESTIKAINQGHVFRYIKKPWSDSRLLAELHNGLAYYKFKTNTSENINPNVPHMAEFKEKERLTGVREMAAAVCHEFSQPLQAISGYSGLLNEIPGIIEDKAVAEEYLSIIQSQVERLSDLLLKVMTIKHYRTKSYSSHCHMVDIENASCTVDLPHNLR